jgi:hypothetical protein
MACEEKWERVRELERELTAAFQEELALMRYPKLGQAVAMTPAELYAIEMAQRKHEMAAMAYHRAALEALNVNSLHNSVARQSN